jgi:hypothetical protein
MKDTEKSDAFNIMHKLSDKEALCLLARTCLVFEEISETNISLSCIFQIELSWAYTTRTFHSDCLRHVFSIELVKTKRRSPS